MIALDTNVLVRFLVEDDVRQSAAAASVVEEAIERGEEIFLAQIVLCELVWVLRHAYGLERSEVAALLHQVRRGAQFAIEGADEVREATEAYASSGGDFADFLIGGRAVAAGCSKVFTFDRALAGSAPFVAPTRG